MEKFCRDCGSPLKKSSKFCPGCGRPIKQPAQESTERPYDEPIPQVAKCIYCGAQLKATSKFCPKCGRTVATASQQQTGTAEKSRQVSVHQPKIAQPINQAQQSNTAQPVQQVVQRAAGGAVAQTAQPIRQAAQPIIGQAAQPVQQAAQNVIGQVSRQQSVPVQQAMGGMANGIRAASAPGELSIGEFGNLQNTVKSGVSTGSIFGGIGIGAASFTGLMLLPYTAVFSAVAGAAALVRIIFVKAKGGRKQ